MENNQVRLRKIPLSIFIQALTEIYNNGVDYVDLIGTPDDEQDTIGIAFCDEYLSKDIEESPDESIEDLKEQIKNINLSDEDLNQLL